MRNNHSHCSGLICAGWWLYVVEYKLIVVLRLSFIDAVVETGFGIGT